MPENGGILLHFRIQVNGGVHGGIPPLPVQDGDGVIDADYGVEGGDGRKCDKVFAIAEILGEHAPFRDGVTADDRR